MQLVYRDTRALNDPDAVWGALFAHGVTIIRTAEPWRLHMVACAPVAVTS